MNGHLDGARMADDSSSRGRVVARPSSIQDEDVGPNSQRQPAQAPIDGGGGRSWPAQTDC